MSLRVRSQGLLSGFSSVNDPLLRPSPTRRPGRDSRPDMDRKLANAHRSRIRARGGRAGALGVFNETSRATRRRPAGTAISGVADEPRPETRNGIYEILRNPPNVRLCNFAMTSTRMYSRRRRGRPDAGFEGRIHLLASPSELRVPGGSSPTTGCSFDGRLRGGRAQGPVLVNARGRCRASRPQGRSGSRSGSRKVFGWDATAAAFRVPSASGLGLGHQHGGRRHDRRATSTASSAQRQHRPGAG